MVSDEEDEQRYDECCSLCLACDTESRELEAKRLATSGWGEIKDIFTVPCGDDTLQLVGVES